MLRIIVRTDDAGMAGNVGGSVLTTFQTFDVELPEVEAALHAKDGYDYTHAQIIGVEIIRAALAESAGKGGG